MTIQIAYLVYDPVSNLQNKFLFENSSYQHIIALTGKINTCFW